MLISVGTVVTLFTYCLVKVLSTPDTSGSMHGMDIDTKDT